MCFLSIYGLYWKSNDSKTYKFIKKRISKKDRVIRRRKREKEREWEIENEREKEGEKLLLE